MTDARHSDPDPADNPDLDSGGSPVGPQTPASASTSLHSDSALTNQSPPPLPSKKGPIIAIVVIVVIVLLLVVGLAGYAFEVF